MFTRDSSCIKGLLEAMDKIIDFTEGYANAEEFFRDTKGFDATMMNFIVMGEMIAKLSEEFKEKHSHIVWAKISGFRNVIAHDYFGIDADEVWQIIRNKLPELRKQINNL